MSNSDCCLCGQIEGDKHRNLLMPVVRTPWAVRPVLLENAFAAVMPSVGALVLGHVLVCPMRHLRSLAIAQCDEYTGLINLAGTAAVVLREHTGLPVHRFEHGSATRGERVACSVEHAHLHLIPTAVDVSLALESVAAWRVVAKGQKALKNAVGAREYLLYEAPNGMTFVATGDQRGFASQLLRRLFADAIGRSASWNWRTHPASRNVRRTVELFLDKDRSAHAA